MQEAAPGPLPLVPPLPGVQPHEHTHHPLRSVRRLLQGCRPGFFVKPLHGDPLPSPAQIRIDVKEAPDAYTVQAEIPGVSKEDIHVVIDGPVVTLRAEVKQQDSRTQDEKVLRTERYYGSVARSFQLASDIDNEKSKAKYETACSA
jgi:HSP20 family protein